MTALEDQAVVSKGKEDLQIMSSACAVTPLAALRAAFMLPQQREGLPRVCNVPFRMLRAGSGGDRADTGRRKMPTSAGLAPLTLSCVWQSLFENLPLFFIDSWRCQLRREAEERGVWASWLEVRSFCHNQQAVSFTNH